VITEMYLGDAVYAKYDGFHLTLTTRDGTDIPTNTIHLEQGVLNTLDMFRKQLQEPEPDDG